MQEDLAQAIEQTLGETLRRNTEELAQQLSAQLTETCQQAVNVAAEAARAEASAGAGIDFANTLAEAVRAIRAEDSVTGIASALVDGAAQFSGRSLLFIHRGDQLLGFRAAGRVNGDQQDGFQKLSTSVGQAAAIGRAIDTLSTVDADGSPDSLSSDVAELLGLSQADQVHLFPVALRDKVLAVLACDAGADQAEAEPLPVNTAAVETLVALAEAWIEAVGTRRKQSAA